MELIEYVLSHPDMHNTQACLKNVFPHMFLAIVDIHSSL